MKKFFKITGIVLLVLIVMMIIYAFLGKKEALNLDINFVDLTKISDGTYTGSYDNYRFSNKVEVTVKDHRITKIKIINGPNNRPVNQNTIDRVINAQNPDLDTISGATADTKAFLKAVENALKSA